MAALLGHILRSVRTHWQRFVEPLGSDQVAIWQRRAATTVGAVVLGLAALAFAAISDRAQAEFAWIVRRWPYLPLIMTPAIFAFVVWITRKWVPLARGSGIPQVIAASRNAGTKASTALVSLRTAIAKLALTVLMLFGGASVGREGPTVQISAAIMVAMHRVLRVPISAGVLIAGGAAGVAAAFNTPLAGVAFAIEELASAYEQRVAILVMGAVMIAGMVSLGVAGDYVYFGAVGAKLPLSTIVAATPVAGIAGGLAGGLFSRLVLRFVSSGWAPARAARSRPVLFALVCGLVVAVAGITSAGETWGTGYAATKVMVEGGGAPWWFVFGKFTAALATTLSGAPGGVFAPSLAVGAGVGNLLSPLFPNDAPGAIVVLGMVAYFVGVVRAPFTAVIIVSEVTASRGLILPLFATALIADAVGAMVCRERLYHGLAKPFLPPEKA